MHVYKSMICVTQLHAKRDVNFDHMGHITLTFPALTHSTLTDSVYLLSCDGGTNQLCYLDALGKVKQVVPELVKCFGTGLTMSFMQLNGKFSFYYDLNKKT